MSITQGKVSEKIKRTILDRSLQWGFPDKDEKVRDQCSCIEYDPQEAVYFVTESAVCVSDLDCDWFEYGVVY